MNWVLAVAMLLFAFEIAFVKKAIDDVDDYAEKLFELEERLLKILDSSKKGSVALDKLAKAVLEKDELISSQYELIIKQYSSEEPVGLENKKEDN